MSVTQQDIETIQLNVVRFLVGNASLVALTINSGAMTLDDYKNTIKASSAAQNGTKPRLLVSNYFNGVTDTSSVLDSGASFCRSQYAAYQAQGVAMPELGPYEALGMGFSSTSQFASKISGKTNAQIWQDAYTYAFNITMTQAQITHFDNQYNYFYNLYISNNIPPATSDLQAKGAVIGQIIGWGGITSGSPVSNKGETWLTNAANGSPAYGTAL